MGRLRHQRKRRRDVIAKIGSCGLYVDYHRTFHGDIIPYIKFLQYAKTDQAGLLNGMQVKNPVAH